MIGSPEDLAELLADAVRRETIGESVAGDRKAVRFIGGPEALFTVETVEGRRFVVRISEEAIVGQR